MNWREGKDQYYLVNGKFTICKVYLSGVCNYELWESGKFIKSFASVDEAKKVKI